MHVFKEVIFLNLSFLIYKIEDLKTCELNNKKKYIFYKKYILCYFYSTKK